MQTFAHGDVVLVKRPGAWLVLRFGYYTDHLKKKRDRWWRIGISRKPLRDGTPPWGDEVYDHDDVTFLFNVPWGTELTTEEREMVDVAVMGRKSRRGRRAKAKTVKPRYRYDWSSGECVPIARY